MISTYPHLPNLPSGGGRRSERSLRSVLAFTSDRRSQLLPHPHNAYTPHFAPSLFLSPPALLPHINDHPTLNMASAIYKPSVLYLETAPAYLFGDLPISTDAMTPRSPNSGIPIQPSTEVNTSSKARSIARILHAHYGTVLADFTSLLAGGVTTTHGIETISSESKAFRGKPLKDNRIRRPWREDGKQQLLPRLCAGHDQHGKLQGACTG
jgi:hypothetical protein